MTECHPTSFEIEAAHAEGPRAPLELHLAGCRACRTDLESLERDRVAFLAARPAVPFVRELRQRLDTEQRQASRASWRVLQLVSLGAVVAMFQLIHVWQFPDGPRATPGVVPPPELAPAEPGSAPLDGAEPAGVPAHSSDMIAKGSSRPALVVRRAGEQFIAHEGATLQPGDELRLRFELAHPGPIEAGILMQSGAWVPFFSGDFSAGLHTPDATLQVDDEPSAGTLLFGSPTEVARARSGSTALVQTLSIEWKPLQ